MSFEKLVFVTGNQNKAREVSQILDFPIEQREMDLPEIQSLKIEEVVTAKALAAFEKLKCPLLVEDTSLVFSSLNGLPGPLVKWFIQSVGVDGMIKFLNLYPDRSATAIACFALCDESGAVKLFLGEVAGRISLLPQGEDGFGWDPIFIPNGFETTFAQMSGQQKNKISHRFRALEKVREYLQAIEN